MPTQFKFDDEQEIEHLPSDFYERIRIELPEGSINEYWANHFHLATALPYALTDLGGLVDASLVSGDFDATPRLMQQRKRAKIAMPYHMPEFDSHFAALKEQALTATQEKLGARQLELVTNSASWILASDSERKAMQRGATPSFAMISNGNLSQQARSIQTVTWQRVQPHFIAFVKEFAAWCDYHGWHYSLRMPIAMSNANRDTLRQSSPLAGIPMPEAYQSATQNELTTRLFDAGILEFVFKHMIPNLDLTPAIENRNNFLWWDSIASFATAMHRDGVMVSLIPATLPPWLMYGHDFHAAYFLNRISLGTYTEVGVAHVELAPNQFPYSVSTADSEHIAKGLNLLAVGISLWATQLRMGTGHRVPSWTQTPINPTLLQWFIEELAAVL